MMRTRVMPVLLLKDKGLVKTVKFKEPRYIGDPINSVNIFNEKEVDELVFLDISSTPAGRGPDFEMIEDIAGEAFMPMAYGGGITTIEEIRRILALGFEKVVLNTAAYGNPDLLHMAVSEFGAQSVVGCIDVKRTLLGRYELYTHSGTEKQSVKLEQHLSDLDNCGIGELLVNSIDRDGFQRGYDIALLKAVCDRVSMPVIACGGAGSVEDLAAAVHQGGVSAVAAGSLFVYKGKLKGVLINYPSRDSLSAVLP